MLQQVRRFFVDQAVGFAVPFVKELFHQEAPSFAAISDISGSSHLPS
jgi:hypothetical protein